MITYARQRMECKNANVTRAPFVFLIAAHLPTYWLH